MTASPKSSSTVDAYANWKHWYPENFLHFSSEKASYFEWHVSRATASRSGKLQVLEIGFGNGEFLGWARAKNHSLVGVELSAHLVQLATDTGFKAFGSLDELPIDMRFDLIVAFDVLEHIPPAALTDMLIRLRKLLKPQGSMLFRFPNAESPLGNVYQNGDITHVNALGAFKFLQLATLTQLTLLHEGDLLPLTALPLRRWPRACLAACIRGGLQWVLGTLLLGHPIRIAANEVVVLASAET